MMTKTEAGYVLTLGDDPNEEQQQQVEYVASETDPTRAAVYCQLLAEEMIDDSVHVLNNGIAETLVQFYGCEKAANSQDVIDVDMYAERERLCGSWGEMQADQSLHREGILEVVRPYTNI